jgi:pimeloyl-ACP methyl ester carboxylesterase
MPHTRRRTPIRWPICILLGIATAASADGCDELGSLSLADTEIVSAALVAAGAFEPGSRFGGQAYAGLPEFCRVEALARPAAGSEIGIEVWLPTANWNGSLQAVGNGAWAGSISHAAMAGALMAGFAATGTDTGHRGGSPGFALEHRDKLIDFAHRAVHQMAVTAKAVTEAYYGRPQERAYFAGCSTGGRQALTAAQRYPDDFDGIVAGAPAYYPSHIQGMQVWTAQASNRSEAAKIGDAEFRLANDAVIAACDVIDGVADGVLENPGLCSFDPTELACSTGNAGACLSPEQVETFRRIYQGPTTRSGDSIFPGLARGSELGWSTLSGEQPLSLARETYELLVFEGAEWHWMNFDADADFAAAEARIGPLMNANDPDLIEFVERGGKLLLYHGWNDPGIPPDGTVHYYEQVRATLGEVASDDAVKLFMVPGMNHCAGGTGTDQFDAVAALDRWMTSEQAPERIPAERQVNGATVRTRPLCPYPAIATYDGTGSTDDAANFNCR